MNKDPFKDYIKESEPDKRDKGYAWHTAIGLQAVDGLKIGGEGMDDEKFQSEVEQAVEEYLSQELHRKKNFIL